MICLIRIRGEVGLSKELEETLNRLRLKRKYSCVVISHLKKEQIGMVKKVHNLIAFGEINKEMFEKLLEKRGKPVVKSKKIDFKKAAVEIEQGKEYEEFNLKPFFRLHPPRKGIKSKLHYPEGVLGNHKEKINELLERML